MAQDPTTVITFEVPDGPPPAELVIEGPEAENMDVEKVREFLQNRWDTFRAFPADFQAALKTRKLDEVNKVLGRMQVPEAEEVVKQLDEAGIMSFSSTDIVDQTGKQ